MTKLRNVPNLISSISGLSNIVSDFEIRNSSFRPLGLDDFRMLLEMNVVGFCLFECFVRLADSSTF